MSITLGALNVTDLSTNGLLFEIREGKPFTLAEYIGADDDIPLASGMDPGKWRASSRTVSLYGVCLGSGADLAAQQASFYDRMIALKTVMDPDSLLTITTAGEFGAASATLENCRPQRMVTQSEFGSIQWIGHLELICIDSPPDWVVVEGS